MLQDSGTSTGTRDAKGGEFLQFLGDVIAAASPNSDVPELQDLNAAIKRADESHVDLLTALRPLVSAIGKFKYKEATGILATLVEAAHETIDRPLRFTSAIVDVNGYRSKCKNTLEVLHECLAKGSSPPRGMFQLAVASLVNSEQASENSTQFKLVYSEGSPVEAQSVTAPEQLSPSVGRTANIIAISANIPAAAETHRAAIIKALDEVLYVEHREEKRAGWVVRCNPFLWAAAVDSEKVLIDVLDETLRKICSVVDDFTADRLPRTKEGRVIVALHLLRSIELIDEPGDTTGIWPESVSIASRLSQGEFRDYDLAFTDTKSEKRSVIEDLPSCVLVTGDVQHLLRNRYSFEPVGEFITAAGQEAAREDIIFRIWSRILSTDNVSQEVAVQARLLIGETLNETNRVARFPVGSDVSGQGASQFFIQELDRQAPDALILHWQCTELRKTDLLTPVAESLRPLISLNRRSRFHRTQEDMCFDPLKAIADWVNDQMGQIESRDTSVACLTSLLVGSSDDKAFEKVVPRLFDFFTMIKQPLRIVVENGHHADELMTRLIAMFGNSLPKQANVRLFVLEVPQEQSGKLSGPAIEQPSAIRSASHQRQLPVEEQRYLLSIAAVLGWDFPLSWLRNCWMNLTNRPVAEFREYFDALLRAGILQHCGMLTDIEDPSRRYREVKWGPVDAFHEFQRNLDERDIAAVVAVFSKVLHEKHLGKPGEPVNLLQKIRCKIRVFRILQIQPAKIIQAQLVMARAWLLVGNRAFCAGATGEAMRRLICARTWASHIKAARSSEESKLSIEIATSLMRARIERREFSLENHDVEKDVEYSRQIQQELGDSPFGWSEEFFALDRAIWAHAIWFSKLSLAEVSARQMHNGAQTAKRLDLQFEGDHALAVTLFSMGKLQECFDHAAHGRGFCISLPKFKPDSNQSHLFGNHDGRVCCKLFVALCRLIAPGVSGGPDEELPAIDDLAKALKFAAGQTDPLTLRIANSYGGLFHLLDLNFDQALELCDDCTNPDVDSPWTTFTALIADCARIGMALGGRLKNDTIEALLEKIQHDRTQWGVNEYDCLWLTYQGVAHELAAEPSQAIESLMSAVNLAISRGERVFLPEIYRYLAWVQRRHGDEKACRETLENGLTEARTMGAMLFNGRLERDREHLEPHRKS